MAMGNLVSGVRKGLAASQVTLHPELMRATLPTCVVLKALTLAKVLRLGLELTWGTDPGTVPCKSSPPSRGFAWTSNSLRKGPTAAACVIGVRMQKIKYFGSWAMESSVMRTLVTVRLLLAPVALRLVHRQMLEMGGKAYALDSLRS
eukprot:jgi/Tetstr1/441118/TSEL_003108.t1